MAPNPKADRVSDPEREATPFAPHVVEAAAETEPPPAEAPTAPAPVVENSDLRSPEAWARVSGRVRRATKMGRTVGVSGQPQRRNPFTSDHRAAARWNGWNASTLITREQYEAGIKASKTFAQVTDSENAE